MAYQTVVVKEPPLLRALPYISIIAFFLIWETAVRSGMIPQTLLAAPSQVFDAFIDKLTNPNPDGAVMATHFKTSLQEAAIGYVLALLVGLPLVQSGRRPVPPHFRTHPAHPAHRVDSPHRVLVRHRSDRQGVHHLDRGHCALRDQRLRGRAHDQPGADPDGQNLRGQ